MAVPVAWSREFVSGDESLTVMVASSVDLVLARQQPVFRTIVEAVCVCVWVWVCDGNMHCDSFTKDQFIQNRSSNGALRREVWAADRWEVTCRGPDNVHNRSTTSETHIQVEYEEGYFCPSILSRLLSDVVPPGKSKKGTRVVTQKISVVACLDGI